MESTRRHGSIMYPRSIHRLSPVDMGYQFFVYFILILFSLLCLFPFLHVLALSLTGRVVMLSRGMLLFPRKIEIGAYRTLFTSPNVMRGFYNSMIITVGGTAVNLVLTSSFAYGVSKQHMPGVNALNFMVVVSMLFPGGIIPLYLVVKNLGMLNTYWAVIIPGGINAFYCILMRNFFENIPKDMFESAYIEGAGEGTIYLKIALPLSKAAVAAFTLFYAVGHWNAFFMALMFISKQKLWPIQIWLRTLISSGYAQGFSSDAGLSQVTSISIQMAIVISVMVPILLVYPFLQKHFAKGVMLGSVKG